MAVMEASDTMVKVVAGKPLKVTPFAWVKPLPVRVTEVPAGPITGVREAMTGKAVLKPAKVYELIGPFCVGTGIASCSRTTWLAFTPFSGLAWATRYTRELPGVMP